MHLLRNGEVVKMRLFAKMGSCENALMLRKEFNPCRIVYLLEKMILCIQRGKGYTHNIAYSNIE